MGRKRCCCNQSSSSSSSSSSGFDCTKPGTVSIVISGTIDGYVDTFSSDNCTRDYSHWNGTYSFPYLSGSPTIDFTLQGTRTGCSRTNASGKMRIRGNVNCFDGVLGISDLTIQGDGTRLDFAVFEGFAPSGYSVELSHTAAWAPAPPFVFFTPIMSGPFTVSVVALQ